MVLGKNYLEESENAVVSPEEFKRMIDELFLLNGVLNIGDFIPWINFLDLQGYIKRMKSCGKKFDRFLEHVLDEHIERKKGVKDYVAKDMVDVLLQLAEDPTLEVKLERQGVKAFTQVLITPPSYYFPSPILLTFHAVIAYLNYLSFYKNLLFYIKLKHITSTLATT